MNALDRYSTLIMSQSETVSQARDRQEDARAQARDRQQAEAALAIRHRREVLNFQTAKAGLNFLKAGTESLSHFIPGADKVMPFVNVGFAFGEYELTKSENKASERAMLAEHEASKAEARASDAKDMAEAFDGTEDRLFEALDSAANKMPTPS